ncbi:hypothetical protein GCM10017559_70600 [Streptosporangium longisporum]|uniref:Uncharacterized protein n=1 Tax=Streptosporangium longisporum TaxID=46187 RepID=A0ABP6L808_9ACTN
MIAIGSTVGSSAMRGSLSSLLGAVGADAGGLAVRDVVSAGDAGDVPGVGGVVDVVVRDSGPIGRRPGSGLGGGRGFSSVSVSGP